MPEIGYWKYVRFTDDEPLWFGTDDDITVVFDSADDRLEFRMKKDIRFEDDAGNEILTLDKVNRHVEIPVQLNVAALEEYAVGAGIAVNATMTFASGSNLNLNGNLLQDAKLGTPLKTNNHDIYDGVSGDTGRLLIGGGSGPYYTTGGKLYMYGTGHATLPGKVLVCGGKATNGDIRVGTYNAALTTFYYRLVVGQGDSPDIDITRAKLDFHDQTLEATAGAIAGYFRLKVGDTEYKVPAYALA